MSKGVTLYDEPYDDIIFDNDIDNDDDRNDDDDGLQGCKFSHSDVNPVLGFLLHAFSNSLVILKSIFNSVVFALRHNQVIMMMVMIVVLIINSGKVRANVVRLVQCKPSRDEAKEMRRRQSTR